MIYVYYAFLPAVRNILDLKALPSEWESYVASVSDEKRRTQSYYVRKLLLCAFNELGLSAEGFVCDEGRWQAKGNTADFSLAHSKNVVAAAVSTEERVGVDVEKISKAILKLEKKFDVGDGLDVDEKKRRLTEKWTEKESAFKCGTKKNGGEIFFNKTVVNANGENYILCVASSNENNAHRAQFIEIRNL